MLDATLEADVDDAVRFELTVHNDGDDPATLRFRDAQRVEVVVHDADDGGEVWRASEGRMYMQVLGSDEVPAGGSVTYDVEWPAPRPGDYRAVGEVTCEEHDLTATTSLSV